MTAPSLHAVTGAYGFTGKYIAQRLLRRGRRVITLTNSPHRKNPFGAEVVAHPFHFREPGKLEEILKGVSVLYNTYWVRFDHEDFTFADAERNGITLFRAAEAAGVERIIHIGITNPSADSPLPYFRGKAHLEEALEGSGISHAILRPAVLFGPEDILINNIAWALRRLPVFGVFGSGGYRLQPIHVDDLAALAVDQGERRENALVQAIGPETFTYRGLVETIGRIIGKRRPIISVPPEVGYWAARLIGAAVGDVFVTRDEIDGLMADLLSVDAPPAGETALTDWARAHADSLGRRYHSELGRRLDRRRRYGRV